MTRNVWGQIDYWMRLLHLYTGLFLVPWMFVYAISAISLNHHALLAKYAGITPPKWETVQQLDFTPPASFPKTRDERATAILRHLDMDGPHMIPRQQKPGQLLVIRVSGAGNRRITWFVRGHKIRVEQQRPFSSLRFVNFLHFRCGYNQSYFAFLAWAVTVDLVAGCMMFWSISGIYIWARQRNRRFWGAVFLIGGLGLFVVLLFLLLQ